MDKVNQRRKVLGYCAMHGSITVRDAFLKLNINSPTKRISEMRRDYEVRTTTEERTNASGETVRYKRYFIAARGDA
jgi:hypothetical protein